MSRAVDLWPAPVSLGFAASRPGGTGVPIWSWCWRSMPREASMIGEFALQLAGHRGGVPRSEGAPGAIRSGPEGRIAVNVLVWADHQVPKDSSRLVHARSDDADAEAFARLVETLPAQPERRHRHWREAWPPRCGLSRPTALRAPARSSTFPATGRRRRPREFVVLLPQARAMAHAQRRHGQRACHRQRGPGASSTITATRCGRGPRVSSLEAADYEAFAEAMRRKLIARDRIPAGERCSG